MPPRPLERLLGDVLGELRIAEYSNGNAENRVLEPPYESNREFWVASGQSGQQSLVRKAAYWEPGTLHIRIYGSFRSGDCLAAAEDRLPIVLHVYRPIHRAKMREPVYWDDLLKNVGLQGLYAAVFGSAAWARFAAKDIAA